MTPVAAHPIGQKHSAQSERFTMNAKQCQAAMEETQTTDDHCGHDLITNKTFLISVQEELLKRFDKSKKTKKPAREKSKGMI